MNLLYLRRLFGVYIKNALTVLPRSARHAALTHKSEANSPGSLKPADAASLLTAVCAYACKCVLILQYNPQSLPDAHSRFFKSSFPVWITTTCSCRPENLQVRARRLIHLKTETERVALL